MNIQELLSMNMDDIKGLDKSQIKEAILGKPDILIVVVVVIVTIFSVIGINSKFAMQKKRLIAEVAELTEKLDVVKKNEIIKKNFEDHIATLPKPLPEGELNEIVSQLAIANDVQIKSFSPAKERSEKFTTISNIKIKVRTKDYQSLIQFVKDIEQSSYALRIADWKAVATINKKDRSSSTKDADITIESVKIK